jgi:hypothetical protein
MSKSNFRLLFRIGVLLFYLTIITACASPQVVYKTIYQDVYVPVRCDISTPTKPAKADNAVLQVIDLITYTHELESALQVCTEEVVHEKSGL